MTKTCPKCHASNRAEAKFCLECNYSFSDQEPMPRLCPAGKHPMDPAWTSCPYCSGSQPTDDSSAGSPQPGAQGNPPIPPPPGGGRKRPPTTPEQQPGPMPNPAAAGGLKPNPAPAPSGGRKKTEFGDVAPQPEKPQPPAASAPRPAQPGTRRIVAALVTYTWQSQGQIFPICEGRNYLGRDSDCEICMDADPQMSGHQSAIFYRGEIFEITDEKSMNGTFVNGKSVPLTGLPLEHNAVIKTGATTWRFVVIPVTER